MRLEKLAYSEFMAQPEEWVFDECTFGDINLIVGKNATGKTRTLRVLRSLAAFISEFDVLQWDEGKYNVEFSDGNRSFVYSLEYHNKEVYSEELKIDNKIKLSRKQNGSGIIYAQQLDQDIQFQTQTDRIALVAKRDSIQHPYIDDLYNWANGVTLLDFGSSLGRDLMIIKRSGNDANQEPENKINIKDTAKVGSIFVVGEKEFGNTFTEAIISDMKYIGYNIEDIGIDFVKGITIDPSIILPSPLSGIYVKESDLKSKTFQHSISQGMFRALSSFIQVNYGLFSKKATCILIDDIGEGLDYSRSSTLVKRLIEKAEGSSIQLIMATNDRFIMNAVPLEYWLILARESGRCINRNYRNSKEMFDEFQNTGLNNFDLFSTGYYKSKK